MRFAVIGLGAIGGVLAGRLAQAGQDVVGVARGAHFDAIRENGLTVIGPTGRDAVRFPVVDDPARLELTPDVVAVLAVKSQDTAGAVARLRLALPRGAAVLSAQNGVANEPTLARVFDRVYGMEVNVSALHLTPGEVVVYSSPVSGVLTLGRFPAGQDATSRAISQAFTDAGFDALSVPDIQRWKYGKLLANLANAPQALCGDDIDEVVTLLLAEADAALAAAGIAVTDPSEQAARRGGMELVPVDGQEKPGGSTWQSVARGAATTEADYLNGEIALLGQIFGVPTPANRTVLDLLARLVAEGRPVGSLTEREVLDAIERADPVS